MDEHPGRSSAQERAVEQAEVIADSSLTLVFRPDDLQHDASPERVRELSRAIDDVVLDASDFEHVTLYSGSGEIMFSTEDGNIGQRLAGERARVRAAYHGDPQVAIVDDTLSVLVGLRFPSGVGGVGAVELSRPADDITSAAGPWRTNMFFLAGRSSSCSSRPALLRGAGGRPRLRARGPRPRDPVAAARPARAAAIEAPRPGLKEEAEARRRAESRAQEAEQRLTLLQDQYRATLEELQATQRIVRDQPPGNDRVLEERAVKAERPAPSSSGCTASPRSATGSPASSSRGGTRSSDRAARS